MAVRKRYRFEEMCSKTNWCKCRSVSAFAIFQKINFCPDCVWIKSRVKERWWWSWLVLLSCLSLSLSVSHTHSLSNTHTRAHTLSLNFEPWSVAFVGKVHIRNRCSQAPAPDVDGYSLRQISLQDYFFTLSLWRNFNQVAVADSAAEDNYHFFATVRSITFLHFLCECVLHAYDTIN